MPRYPQSYDQQFHQQQHAHFQQQQQHQQQQQQYYQPQQPQQHYLNPMQMSSSPPEYEYGGGSAIRSGRSPASEADDGSSSCFRPQRGHSPGGWSSQTDSSGFSSPPSDASGHGGDEWDLLSDMLMGDAVATSAGPAAGLMASSMVAAGGYQQALCKQQQSPFLQQQIQQQQFAMSNNASLTPPAPTPMTGARNGGKSPVATHPLGVLYASPAPSSAPDTTTTTSSSSPSVVSQSAQATNISPLQRTRANAKKPAEPVKVEAISSEEQKKLRRRTQIASSVQRHREKKKNLVSTLKEDLASLTSQLEFLRSQRKSMHANDRMVEWEEIAITQRRKRRQSEEVNERIKKALFQQTSFLFGMRAMMNDLPSPREFEFHDWIHSYTVLSARDPAYRRKEYASYFSESKMDLAAKIVLRETDLFMSRLDRSRPYYANVRLLHDGTRAFLDEEQVVVKRELKDDCFDVGNGQVMKKFTSVFLFEDRADLSFSTFHQVAWECTKQVGVFWPGAGYESRLQDVVDVNSDSRVYFTDLSASMDVIDDVKDSGDTITVESRMLCREQSSKDESIFVWDYVDKDDLYPLPIGEEALEKKTITRKSCGVVVVRKEPDGLVSMRSTSVKIFDTTLPDAKCDADTETIASMNRRLGLQATESERGQQKCTKYVYDAINAVLQQHPPRHL